LTRHFLSHSSTTNNIPLQLQPEFEAFLSNRPVPTGSYPFHGKWLRFYLGVCQKYRFPETERKSLDYFLRKLQGKKQTGVQRQQASHAVQFIVNSFNAVTQVTIPPYPWE
jgi:hypothetical protein